MADGRGQAMPSLPVTDGQSIPAVPAASPPPETSLRPSAPAETLETVQTAALPAPGEGSGLPAGLWIGLGVVAALAAVVLIRVLLRRRRQRGGENAPGSGAVAVGKLHRQGARKDQQDCFSVSDPAPELVDQRGLLAVLADGMGGLKDGDQVSRRAVEAMMNGFYLSEERGERLLLSLLAEANRAVNDLLEGRQEPCGSTLAAGLLWQGRFYHLSVGDSRICLFRGGRLFQLNREHVFRRELELRAVNGEGSLQQVQLAPDADGLTSYLGMGKLKYVDLPARPVEVLPGDRFLLMSDGVYNALSDGELTAAMEGLPAEEAARAIDRAVEEKGYAKQDNYTAVLLDC